MGLIGELVLILIDVYMVFHKKIDKKLRSTFGKKNSTV